MRARFLVFPLESIVASIRFLLGFVARCILLGLCLIAVAFASIQLISWAIDPWGLNGSLMAVLPSDNAWGVLRDKKLY